MGHETMVGFPRAMLLTRDQEADWGAYLRGEEDLQVEMARAISTGRPLLTRSNIDGQAIHGGADGQRVKLWWLFLAPRQLRALASLAERTGRTPEDCLSDVLAEVLDEETGE
jgi:hypothetical protein